MTERYDRAVTIFSPDGHLLQVEYAQEAVRKGSTAVGLRTTDLIILGVEKRSIGETQDDRTLRKICVLDEHVVLTFAGLTADARVIVNRAQVECQSHRLNFERPVSIEYITRFIAQLKQNYTQSNGRRPFGVSCLVGGFDEDGKPRLFQTEPSGIYYEWAATTTGRSSQGVRAFMEKNTLEAESNEEVAVKYIVSSLLSGSQHGGNLEVALLKYKQPIRLMERETIAEIAAAIEHENHATQVSK